MNSRIKPVLLAAVTAMGLGRIAMAAPPPSLTLYAAQHHQMVDLLTSTFTRQTGIEVRVRQGEAPELANQLVKEGAASPADIFFTENSPELVLLDERKLLAKVDPSTLAARAGEIQRAGRELGRRARARERARLQSRP